MIKSHVGYAPVRYRKHAAFSALFSFPLYVSLSFGTLMTAQALRLHSTGAPDWAAVGRMLIEPSLHFAIVVRAMLALIIAMLAAVRAYSRTWANTALQEPFLSLDPADPKLYYDEFARCDLIERFRQEAGNDKGGLWLAPHLQLPFSLETKGIMVVGAPNSGKSNIVRALAEQAVYRNDRVLLHCNKGDITQSFKADDAILIAAHHRDSHAWDLAADISDPAAAAQFASDIIPRSDNPFWSDTARLIATDVIMSLIRDSQRDWDARELLTRLISDPVSMADTIKKLDLSASPILQAGEADGLDKTVMGVMSTLWSGAYTGLRPMAYAWTGFPPERRFSVKRWLSARYTGPRVVIIQTSPEYEEVSTAIAGAIIKRIATRLADPSLPTSPTRRVVTALDEIHALKRIENLHTALALGREKGLVPIVALQSLSQLTEIYGEELANIISDQFQIKIYGRLIAGANTDKVEQRLGKRFISALLSNRTPEKDDKRKYVEHRSTEPTFSATRLQKDVGVFKPSGHPEYVRAVVHCYGNGYLLNWPMTRWRKLRPGYVAAPWLNLMAESTK